MRSERPKENPSPNARITRLVKTRREPDGRNIVVTRAALVWEGPSGERVAQPLTRPQVYTYYRN